MSLDWIVFLIIFNFVLLQNWMTNFKIMYIVMTNLMLIFCVFVTISMQLILSFLYNPMFMACIWSSMILSLSLSQKQNNMFNSFFISLMIVISAGFCLLSTNSLFFLIFSFELMLLSACNLLSLTSKSERSAEALVEMYIWGAFGSMLLLTALSMCNYSGYFINNSSFFFNLGICFLMSGFCVKIPLWPFMSWLMKAHVEASTEFSIYLSGFLVKFGVCGLIHSLLICNSEFGILILLFFSSMGMMDGVFSLFSQVDMKSMVALTTVMETNWLSFCLTSGMETLENLGNLLMVIHCFTTTAEFYTVELLYKSYGSSSLLVLSGFNLNCPNLTKMITCNYLVTMGLPGTSIFMMKFKFLIFLNQMSILLLWVFGFIFLMVLPMFFLKNWSTIFGTQNYKTSKLMNDLSFKDLFYIGIPLMFTMMFGLYPGLF